MPAPDSGAEDERPPAGRRGGTALEARTLEPNLVDYEATVRDFRWKEARRALDGLPGGRLNIAHEAVDRHAAGERAGRVAIRWLGRRGERRELTYAELADEAARFAGALRALGVGRGDHVFALTGRIPELYSTVLGTLRYGAVFSPLFSAFGPEPVQQRLALGEGKALVTTPSLDRRKVAPVRDRLPALKPVLVITALGEEVPEGTAAWRALVDAASPEPVARTRPEDPALLHFTSGTTGRPKGALHVHDAIVAHS